MVVLLHLVYSFLVLGMKHVAILGETLVGSGEWICLWEVGMLLGLHALSLLENCVLLEAWMLKSTYRKRE